MQALSIKGVTKTYASGVRALKGIDLQVEQGDFFALLGPNGAGKTTLIGILTSLVSKSSGDVKIMGYDIDTDFGKAKSCLGVVPQEYNFNIFEKVENVVLDQAGYYGVPRKVAAKRAEKYLKLLDLWEKRHSSVRSLSGGMKRRLMIVRALIHEPKLLILDEPTAGVDVELRRSTWEFLNELNAKGMTIILTTHYLEEAESHCRNIAIIDHGEIVENTSMANLLKTLDFEHFILYVNEALTTVPESEQFSFRLLDEYTLEAGVPRDVGVSALFNILESHQIKVGSLRNKVNRLEELFIRLTKRE